MEIMSFLRDDGACGYYRIALPVKTVAKHTDTNVLMINRGDPISKIVTGVSSQLMLFPRLAEDESIELMEVLQDRGIKFVVDYDDNMFEVSPFSPHYKDFGCKEIQILNSKQEVVHLWKDGETFDLKANIARLDAIKRGVAKADAITVTTEVLANVYRQYNDKVYVLPNCVDLNIWKKLPLVKDTDEIRLYWSGGSSHFEDVVLLNDVFPYIMNKYPQVKLVMMGVQFKGVTGSLDQSRVEFHGWVPTPAYPYKTAIMNADISVIPLADTTFNSCKSNIKWIEQSALLVPSVTSLVSPYKEWYDGTNGVFVENNKVEGFCKGIEFLIENEQARKEIGEAARRTVEQNFNIDNEYLRWYQAFQEIIYGN